MILLSSSFSELGMAILALSLSLFVEGKFGFALMLLSLLICNRLFIKNRVKDITTDSATVSESDSDSSDIDGEYEVFLSFHGEDTRKVFADFLYTFLRVARIHTFRDNEDLRVGETIGSEIVEAIKQSKISIPIFSKNYAFSKWCMLEVVQMVESMELNGQKIFPIFYDVRPYDVRHQTGNYEKAFHQHRKNFDLKTVQQWKDALAKVGKIKGLELENETKGYQGKLAKKIVKKVLHKLKKSAVNLPEILVDMEHHKEKLKTLLNLNSNCVRVVGIHGMGGIGKTTIAKVIYNELRKNFASCFFLENIQEKSHDPKNLIKVQNQLISVLGKGKFRDIVNTEEGRERTKDVIKGKKTLLVLDDVDENSQFDMLVSNSNIFAPGSRIIVTTRNKEVLNYLESTYEVYRSYEPSLMNFDQSLQLFSKFAFSSDIPPKDYSTLSENIISAVAGLPLAIKSIAKSLRGNHDRESWNAKLQEIQKIPHPVVLGTLRRSFEALNDREQHVFLDIACLFIGEDRFISSYMWKDCELNPASAIHTNVLKSLLKVKDDDSLWMHEQLRDFGRQIVREENIDQAGNRSRLWHREEALDIFDRCMGTNKVLALWLDLIQEEHESRPNRLIREDFGKLQNLRFLRVGFTDLEGDFKHLFSSLRWLQWKPLGNLSPTDCRLKNLVILDLSGSHIMDDWEGWHQIKRSTKLKVLNLSNCAMLCKAPDFSTFETLERLILCYCLSLSELDTSIHQLINLRLLDLSNCMVLSGDSGVLDFSGLTNLEYLDIRYCLQLCEISGLGSSVELKYLNTSGCRNLRKLPNLSQLTGLNKISTSECNRLVEIQGLDKLESLEYLDIRDCVNIKCLPSISNLKLLKEIILCGCNNLSEVEGMGELESIETLDMSWCKSLEKIPDLSKLKKLRNLKLAGFETSTEIQGLKELTSLELLNISGWIMSESPDLSNLKKLRGLDVSYCVNLRQIRGLEELEFIEVMNISGCESIKTLPNLSNLQRLKELNAHRCSRLSAIRGLDKVQCLELVNIAGCTSLEPFPYTPNTTIVEFQ